jgi:heme/copper-type cytochrome/quinol oxidase subunit 4
MNKLFLKRLFLTAISFVLSPFLWAQTTSQTIDETMRSHDKIYVVMAVCIVILIVFLLYLIRIDNKVSKKEKSVQ